MSAASQVPSAVFTSTSVSTMSAAAAEDPAAAVTPAANESAVNSRREILLESSVMSISSRAKNDCGWGLEYKAEPMTLETDVATPRSGHEIHLLRARPHDQRIDGHD